MTDLVDDQCLSLVLRGQTIDGLNGPTFTTGLWYFRLCQAYFRTASSGALSRPYMELPEPQRSAVEARILELPKTIGMISFRELVPVMARQVDRYPHLRLLAREALAAASILGARVLLKTAFPTLEAVLAAEGLEAQHVA